MMRVMSMSKEMEGRSESKVESFVGLRIDSVYYVDIVSC